MIANRIYAWAREQPTRTALICDDVSLSYAAFARAIEATRAFLEFQRLPVGRTAVVLAQSPVDRWVALMALRTLGLDTIFVQSLKDAEALQVRNVACVVLHQPEQEEHNLNGDILLGTKIVSLPAAIYSGIQVGDVPQFPDNLPPLGGHILYTSGTTGSYKKVLWEGRNEQQRIQRASRIRSNGIDTIHHLVNFPPWTVVGFSYPLAVWHAGGSIVFDQRPNWAQYFFRYEVNKSILIPSMLAEIVNAPRHTFGSTTKLDLSTTGFVPRALLETAAQQLNAMLTNTWGSTECSHIASSRYETVEEFYWLAPHEDRTIEVVDEDGSRSNLGQEGRVRIRLLDTDATSYLDDEETSTNVFRDGFFYTGDIAIRRADGRIRLLGRASDVLNVNGFKIAGAPLEEEFQHILKANAVCLFSGLNQQGIEELVVAIEAERAPSQSELSALAERLRGFEKIRFVVLKDFPRSDAGMQKIRRTELRKLVFGAT